MTIDHDGAVPVYRQLANLLRAQIASGELPPGRAIPAESRLMQIHDLGRDSVRKAVAILREEGLVVAVQGRGTFVKPQEQAGE
ncbi:winged helix-turn-helix domain-containing protein [Streptosporangium sp. NPDC006930]|uniref:GntR family transcriptional regulator n=1 Tax=Streptosporangium sp. NPDC006930 TaxID=3154783 RepID=UPI00344A8FF5